jgi:MOSC domain-containing protein YiiM
MPVGTHLYVGATAVVELTGLRNPCAQLDQFQKGLTSALLGRTPEGKLIRKAGVMGVVVAGGVVQPGDAISVKMPSPPHRRLERV